MFNPQWKYEIQIPHRPDINHTKHAPIPLNHAHDARLPPVTPSVDEIPKLSNVRTVENNNDGWPAGRTISMVRKVVDPMGALSSFLSSFSGSFKAALIMWPVLSFLFTMPILAFLYHRDGRLRFLQALAAYCSVLYAAGLACFTLYPLPSGDSGPGITYGIPPQLNPLNFIFDIMKDGWKALFQTLFNVVLFMPLGFIAGRFLQMKLPTTAILSLIITCLIETAQLTGLFGIYPYAYRTFEVDDIIFNTLGGVLGWYCAKLFSKALPPVQAGTPEITHNPGLVRRIVALWIDGILVGLTTFGPWIFFYLASEILFNQAFAPFGIDAAQTESVLILACFMLALCGIELVFPWVKDGSTPGGLIVRMSFETKRRWGFKRALFYGVRSVFLICLFSLPHILIPLTVLFYLIAHKMPYDYLP